MGEEMKTTYVRLPPADHQKIAEIAAREGLTMSDVIRRAVREMLQRAEGMPEPVRPEIPMAVVSAGRWYVSLPEAIQVKVQEVGDGLSLLYAARKTGDGRVVLANGTVRNIFVSGNTPDTEKAPRRKSSRPSSREKR